MARETKIVPTDLEHTVQPEHEALALRGETLLAEASAYEQQCAVVQQEIEDLMTTIDGAIGEQHDVLVDAVTQREAALREHLQALHEQHHALLMDWEQSAITHLGQHVGQYNSLADNETASRKMVSGIELPESTLTRHRLRGYRAVIQNERSRLAGAHFLVRLMSRAHNKEKADIAGHERIMDTIYTEAIKISDNAEQQLPNHNDRSKALVAELRSKITERLGEQARARVNELRGVQDEQYQVANDEAFLTRMNDAVFAEVVQPVLDDLTAGDNVPEERKLLAAEWGTAMYDLLSHAMNSTIEPSPEELAALAAKGDKWYGYRTEPIVIHGKEINNYGHKERELRELLAKSFPRDPHDRWHYTNPADEQTVKHLEQVVRDCAFGVNQAPTKYVSDVVKLFADWQANQAVSTDVAPQLRPPLSKEQYSRLLQRDGLRMLDEKRELLESLKVLGRWKHIQADPELQATTQPERFEQFEQFITNLLLDQFIRPGGRESWDGTHAVHIIESLNSPRVLPALLEHIMYSGSGHTTVQVYGAIEALAATPEGQAYVATLPPLEHGLLQQMGDSKSVLNTEYRPSDIYAKTALIGRGEFFLVKTMLTDLFAKDTQYAEGVSERRAFLGEFMTDTDILTRLQTHQQEVEQRVLDGTDYAPWWAIHKLSDMLAKNTEFVRQVGYSALGEDASARASIDDLTQHREFIKSTSTRSAVLQGTLFLRSQGEVGQTTLRDLLSRYRGSKDDPKRLRKLFRTLEVLHKFREGTYDYDSTLTSQRLATELANVDERLAGTADKTERKQLRTQRDRLAREQDYADGLAGAVDHFQGKVADVMVRKLHLPDAIGQQMADKFDEYVDSGLVDIGTTLMLSFEGKKVERPQVALAEVCTHIVAGDFQAWKYSHEYAQEQLRFLGEDKSAWIANEPAVVLEPGEDESKDSEFSYNASAQFINDALNHLGEIEDAEKATPIAEKLLQLQQQLRDRTIELPAVLEAFTTVQLEAASAGYTQVASDIEQCSKPFFIKELGTVRAEEFDDALRLIKMGTEPSETCQSWKRGMYNECLLAYVADGDKKGMNVRDEAGNVLVRCVERITESREGYEGALQRSLVLEPPYALTLHPRVFSALAKLALNKAEKLGAIVEFSPGWPEEAAQAFQQEAEARGKTFTASTKRSVRLSRSINQFNYSDTFGGRLEPHGEYVERDLAVIQ